MPRINKLYMLSIVPKLPTVLPLLGQFSLTHVYSHCKHNTKSLLFVTHLNHVNISEVVHGRVHAI